MATLVIAHRGASAEKPENTLAAFRRALDVPADGIELDVHLTRDGVPVVFHDTDLLRLTGVPGRITGQTWSGLMKLRVRGSEPIPRLVDVLRLTRGCAMVQIELKTGVAVAPVVRAIKTARAMEWVILASFVPGLVREARQLAPTVPRMLIAESGRPLASLGRQLAAVGAAGLSVDHHAITDAVWPGYFQARGYSVWCWTVNDPARMRQLAAWGVNALLSDNPALLRRTLSRSRNLSRALWQNE